MKIYYIMGVLLGTLVSSVAAQPATSVKIYTHKGAAGTFTPCSGAEYALAVCADRLSHEDFHQKLNSGHPVVGYFISHDQKEWVAAQAHPHKPDVSRDKLLYFANPSNGLSAKPFYYIKKDPSLGLGTRK